MMKTRSRGLPSWPRPSRLGALAFALLSWSATEIGSETLTVTSAYPAPAGVYNQIVTTGDANPGKVQNTILNRNAGNTLLAPTGASSVGIGTLSPSYKLDVQGGAIRAGGGLIIETRTSDPPSPAPGQLWLRTDL